MADRPIPYGRGGAGNMATPDSTRLPSPKELITPTLKANVYTTGRGGSGNMVTNENPVIARESQDVGVPPNVAKGSADEGTFTVGRGGAANIYRTTSATEQPRDLDLEANSPLARASTHDTGLLKKFAAAEKKIKASTS